MINSNPVILCTRLLFDLSIIQLSSWYQSEAFRTIPQCMMIATSPAGMQFGARPAASVQNQSRIPAQQQQHT